MKTLAVLTFSLICISLAWGSYSDLQVYQTYAGELDDFETNVSHHNPARAETIKSFALSARPRLGYDRLEGSGVSKFTTNTQINYFDQWFTLLGVYAGAGFSLLQDNTQSLTQGANNYALALSFAILPALRIGLGSRVAFGLGNTADAADASLRARGGVIFSPEKSKWQIGYTTHFYADIADFNAYLNKYDAANRFNYDTDIANQSFMHKFSFRLKHHGNFQSHLLLSTYLQTQNNDFFISASYFLQQHTLINWHTGFRIIRKRFDSAFSDDDTVFSWLVGIHFRPFSMLSLKAGLTLMNYENNLLGGSNNQVRSKTFSFLASLPNLGFKFHFTNDLDLDLNLNEQIIRSSELGTTSDQVRLSFQLNYRLPEKKAKTISVAKDSR